MKIPGTTRLAALFVSLASLMGACSGAPRSAGEMRPIPDKLTRATLVGPLCDAQMCKCMAAGDNPGLPESPGVKRYQIKVGPTDNELWVMVDDMVLYKTVERASECFIVDLRQGKHPITLRARGETGFSARLHITEIGEKGVYRSFDFRCGGPGPCTYDALDSFKAGLAKYKRGVHDPCGSTRIRAVNWLSGESPDRVHLGELQLDFTLQVYDFAPRHEPGHPECRDRY